MRRDDEAEEDPRTLLRRGDAAKKRGDVASAVVAYVRAGDAYVSMGQHMKALFVWKQLVSLCPDRLDVRLRLAEALSLSGLVKEALEEFRVVVEGASAAGNKELHDRAALGMYALTT
jgi:tetratricopeptide (TPR) repeat protein